MKPETSLNQFLNTFSLASTGWHYHSKHLIIPGWKVNSILSDLTNLSVTNQYLYFKSPFSTFINHLATIFLNKSQPANFDRNAENFIVKGVVNILVILLCVHHIICSISCWMNCIKKKYFFQLILKYAYIVVRFLKISLNNFLIPWKTSRYTILPFF